MWRLAASRVLSKRSTPARVLGCPERSRSCGTKPGACGRGVWPQEEEIEDRFEQPLIDALGDDEYRRAHEEGGALSFDETLALARSLAGVLTAFKRHSRTLAAQSERFASKPDSNIPANRTIPRVGCASGCATASKLRCYRGGGGCFVAQTRSLHTSILRIRSKQIRQAVGHSRRASALRPTGSSSALGQWSSTSTSAAALPASTTSATPATPPAMNLSLRGIDRQAKATSARLPNFGRTRQSHKSATVATSQRAGRNSIHSSPRRSSLFDA